MSQHQHLEFDTLNWALYETTDAQAVYCNEYDDTMQVLVVPPNGTITKEGVQQEMPNYRNWLRSLAVEEGGGLIFVEYFTLENGLSGSESILKIPRKESTGMDYTYFLNLQNYEEQKLYQIIIKVLEMSPTGMRDNVFLMLIADIIGQELLTTPELFRQDPYDKRFTEGNTMNLSERSEFDYLFPFHPLSIIRNEIAPQLKKTLKFIN
ncbi:MAG: hypothetical protein MK212_21620 [Saprospiraceae bacterium]|nr:hypothetical protein [Saprospiraceae bacterium]